MWKKKPVIGGVWCLSNTERLVMIPLALHTKRERQTEREERIGGDSGSQWEGDGGRTAVRKEKKQGEGNKGTLTHTMIIITNDLSRLTATWLRV